MKDFTMVRELYPQNKGGWFARTQCPPVDFTTETAWSMDAQGVAVQLANQKDCDKAVASGCRVFAIARQKMPFSQIVTAACHEGRWTWNYVMEGEFEIADAAKFLRRWAAADGACGVYGLLASRVVTDLWSDFEVVVRSQIQALHTTGGGQYSVAQIEEQGVLPRSAWRNLFAGKEMSVGCAVQVTDARFVSPDAECDRLRAEALEAQTKLVQQEQLAFAAAVNKQTQAAQFDQIEQARQLARKEFEVKQGELETAIKKQKIDLEIYQKQKLNQIEIELLQAQIEAEIRKADAKRAGDTAQVNAATEQLTRTTQALSEILDKIAKTTENLAKLNVSAEWRPPASLSDENLRQYASLTDRYQSIIGESSANQTYDTLNLKWEVARGGNCGTRDLVSMIRPHTTQTQSHPVLHVGDFLTLRLRSARSGYLTLINIGTSGRVTKIFPAPEFGVTVRRIDSGKTYSLPGELMSKDRLGGCWEVKGPTSDSTNLPERVLAVLTESPVELDVDRLGREAAQSLKDGGLESVEKLVSKSGNLKEGSWCFGLIEARVEA